MVMVECVRVSENTRGGSAAPPSYMMQVAQLGSMQKTADDREHTLEDMSWLNTLLHNMVCSRPKREYIQRW